MTSDQRVNRTMHAAADTKDEKLISYGPQGRRVAVPMEWVVRRTPTRVTLAVGTRELNDLPDQRELGPNA
jgi:hypothetical protein